METDRDHVGDVIFGTSSQRGRQGGDLARMAALEAGYDIRSSGMTLDRFCGSGITSVNLAAANIIAGVLTLLFVVGGIETEPFFLFFVAIEVILMLVIIRIAWKWPKFEV